ncbi:MAG: NFACT RNA binding domain-containing protein [Oscillospiraceae bacterium]|nr:NFACT RNA binding domain-containing protein [Oscillospiraceae bacterium]
MPLDAVYLSALADELRTQVIGQKIDKIYQPTRDEVVLALRGREGACRLLLCANTNHPRAHLTDVSVENPASPPMFCMLLRKHLLGGRILEIIQPPMERVLDFSFQCTNEFGDEVQKHLIIEIMGRNSNLILTDPEGRIIDCVRRVDYEMSEQRQVLPGLYYHLPPTQNKINPLTASLEEISGLLSAVSTPTRPDSFLMDHFTGLPPLICRELIHRFDSDLEDLNPLSPASRYTLAAHLRAEFQRIAGGCERPYVLLKNGTPWDYTYLPISQYGALVESQPAESFSAVLDQFYAKRDAAARMKSKSQAIVKSVTNLRNRTARKLENQKKELAATADRDTYRIRGELITANLYRMEKGATKLVCENYYDPELKEVEIPLNALLTPQQNAAKYFKDYNKAKTAEIYLTGQIANGQIELEYLESILDELSRAETEKDLTDIRAELIAGGYLRNTDRKKKMKTPPSKPMEFMSSSGMHIRVGRNNTQNDQLTLKSSFKYDMWLHTQKIHGSHVIISCDGQEPDEDTLIEAAMLAAYYSQARESQNVPVDYTIVKNVKKPSGAKPGMVIYDHYNTVYVDPDPALAEQLKVKK